MVWVGIAMGCLNICLSPMKKLWKCFPNKKPEMFSNKEKQEMEMFSIVNNVYFPNLENKKYWI